MPRVELVFTQLLAVDVSRWTFSLKQSVLNKKKKYKRTEGCNFRELRSPVFIACSFSQASK